MAASPTSGVILGTNVRSARPAGRAQRPVGAVVWAVALLLLLGSMLDLAVLWVLQHQSSPQWEFVAVSNTIEGFSRFGIAAALAYVALSWRPVQPVWGYRILGVLVVLVGCAAAALGLLLVTDYFPLADAARQQPQVVAVFRSTFIKSLGLAAICFVTLVPAGIISIRRSTGASASV